MESLICCYFSAVEVTWVWILIFANRNFGLQFNQTPPVWAPGASGALSYCCFKSFLKQRFLFCSLQRWSLCYSAHQTPSLRGSVCGGFGNLLSQEMAELRGAAFTLKFFV